MVYTKNDIYAVCRVKFSGSDKIYAYYVNEEMCGKIRNTLKKLGSTTVSFRITNEQGYGYRNTRVILQSLEQYDTKIDSLATRWIAKAYDFATDYSCDAKISFGIVTSEIMDKADKSWLQAISTATSAFDNLTNTLNQNQASYDTSLTVNWGTNYAINENLNYNTSSGVSNNYVSTPHTLTINNDGLTITNKIINNEKENKSMFNNLTKNFKFGPATNVRLSIYGPAFETTEKTWISYDKKTSSYVDVTDMLLDMNNMCYMMPVAKSDIKVGDFILHLNRWCRIIAFDNKRPIVEIPSREEVATIVPTKNIFGFDFYTKLVSFADNMFDASTDHPFGNLLPLLLMDNNNNDMLPLLMMGNSGLFNGAGFDMSNPMVMYLMLGKNNTSTRDMLLMMNLANLNKKVEKVEE